MIGELAKSHPITVEPDNLRRILVISSFDNSDPIKYHLVSALYAISDRWVGKVDIDFQRISSRHELISSLNGSDAPILIFDGHGSGSSDSGIATLRIGGENLDVWSLRGEVRVPPIVILSACDTHEVDAQSHATVANGFLAIGAQTVLATMLPVGGRSSAAFIARLIFRLAEFIPAALRSTHRVVNWTEIISGMQKMLLASEILDGMIGTIENEASARYSLQTNTNLHINSGNPDWYELLIAEIAEQNSKSEKDSYDRANAIISRSEAIRYIQLGNPENILIDDGSIHNTFFTERAGFAISANQIGTPT